jgi:phenylalanine-4-hydroxylase
VLDEATLYAPVVAAGDAVRVALPDDHPGVHDADYRARRDAIAALALSWRPGDPVPDAPYTEQEHAVWARVSGELAVLHQRLACRPAREGAARLALPTDRIPQLREVTGALVPWTGFTYLPAAGLVPLREFYGSLADRRFWSTQYIRHHSVPLYTPEPDVVHEVVGHATTLASEEYAALYVAAGQAARRVESDAALEFVSRVFWFSLEFGVVAEDHGWTAYGAGLLSSYGEIQAFRSAEIRPLDITAMGTLDYDITRYQPVLFGGRSWAQVEDVVGGFFAAVDDDLVARLSRAAAGAEGEPVASTA